METDGADGVHGKAASNREQDGRSPMLKSGQTHGKSPQKAAQQGFPSN
jgi:hypothetical protein